jgi:hypothetical protein
MIIEGTKDAEFQLGAAVMDVAGEELWNCLNTEAVLPAWSARMAVKVVKKKLPFKVCPHGPIKTSWFKAGETQWRGVIEAGTDGTGQAAKFDDEKIIKRLGRLARNGNPPITLSMMYAPPAAKKGVKVKREHCTRLLFAIRMSAGSMLDYFKDSLKDKHKDGAPTPVAKKR